MIPIERTVAWLCQAINNLPAGIRMIYIESGDYVTSGSDGRMVARYDLFGFEQIPDGQFDPDNDDHVDSLGDWEYEASPSCAFPDLPYDDYNWLEVLEWSVRDPQVLDTLNHRQVLLLFAEHDGPIIAIQ